MIIYFCIFLSSKVADNSKRREDTEQSRREEEMKMLAEVRRQIQADEDAMLRRQAEERARGREIRDDNMLHRHQLEQERVTQRRQDTILLEHALRVEKSQIAQEEAKKQVNRDAGADYKFYLEQQMIKEKEDCAVVDEMCKQEEERVWKQREDMLQAREDARKYLQRLVEEGRQQQIRDLAQKRLLEKMEGKEFAEKFIQSVKEGLAREREEQEELRQKNLGNRAMLQEQIDLRRQRDEIEKQQEFLQRKEAAYIEKLHQERLQSQAGAVRVHFPINSRQQW